MGTVEWVVIGFVVLIILIILGAFFLARWLYKKEEE